MTRDRSPLIDAAIDAHNALYESLVEEESDPMHAMLVCDKLLEALAKHGVARCAGCGFVIGEEVLVRALMTGPEGECRVCSDCADSGQGRDGNLIMPRCTQHDCELVAIVKMHGPHGIVRYCTRHAVQYQAIMGALGVSAVAL
jgi:hypothetical protein